VDLSLVPIWITSTASVGGVIYAIVRNGSRNKKQDAQLKTEIKMEVGVIQKQLEDPETGLSAIKKSVDDQRLRCAEVSTAITGQVKTNSDEIAILRKKKR